MASRLVSAPAAPGHRSSSHEKGAVHSPPRRADSPSIGLSTQVPSGPE
jgi:hypothetical protein